MYAINYGDNKISLNLERFICSHTGVERVFHPVLCPTQPLAKRVSLVTLGCLLLVGVLFAAYSVIKDRLSPPPPPVVPGVYPDACKEAIEFAMKNLADHPTIKEGTPFSSTLSATKTHQPLNPQITALKDLFDLLYAAFTQS